MSYLNQLLKGTSVEWLPLGDFANYEQPTKYLVKSKNYDDSFDTPVLTAGKTFILGYTNEKDGIYKASEKPVIIFDDFTTANKWVDFDFKAKSSAMKMITATDEDKVLLKYIFYWLNSLPSGLVAGDHKRQWISNYSKKLIPIPDIEIQKEIVRILDSFTELTKELTEELTEELKARELQFSYYRECLLTFDKKDITWKPLIELAQIGTGSHDTKDAIDNGKYTFYARGKKPLKLNSFDFDETAIITAGDGVGVGKVFHWVTGKYALHQRAYRVVPKKEEINPRFLYHYIVARFYDYVMKTSVHSSVTSLRKPMFQKFQVPLPSPEQQQRIVRILDKFDTLTTSISEGLPKEIELREKQYEYYRDQLLTFPNEA